MAQIKIDLIDGDYDIQVSSDSKENQLPENFSLSVSGYCPFPGKGDETEIVHVLLDRYEMQELIIKLQMLLRNQVK